MTGKSARRPQPDLMGGPEPDEEGTDVMEGPDPGEHTDVMNSPEPEDRRTAS